jgi:cytochrome c oxidase assembly protein subunit 15
MDSRLRTLVRSSAVATGVLMLLGVYTAAAGAGLTCEARWPLCDGAVFGLFPANWGSFVEWFHRLVAMLTGALILGTTVAAWRRGAPRRVRLALAGATLLLPSQIALGALTVTRYELVILTAHFVTAAGIYSLVVAAAAWVTPADAARLRRTVALAAGALPLVALLSPRVLVTFDATVQFVYYGLGLAAYGALLAATLWGRDGASRAPAKANASASALTAAAAVGLLAILVVGRQAYAFVLPSLVGALAVFALAAVAAVLLYRGTGDAPGSSPAPSGD